jgi:LETM1 and EF-hand domain-containing protein 1
MELREACRERGMRSTGLSKDAYKWNLQQWLDLSVNKNVPISLLIMSRTFFLRDELAEPSKPGDESMSLAAVVDAISGLDKEVLNEVILDVATADEKKADPNIRKIKLEVLSAQNQLIRKEQEARDAAAKKKDAPDRSEDKAKVVDAAETASGDDSVAGLDANTKIKKMATDETIAAIEAVVEEDQELSADEMEAISQLISADPVSKERADLARIKAAMRKKDEIAVDGDAKSAEAAKPVAEEPITPEEVDRIAVSIVEHIKEAKRESDASTTVAMDGKIAEPAVTFAPEEIKAASDEHVDEEDEEDDDPVVRRLKERLESMVDKIEVQLSEVQVQIGDKLHFLDKDRDEIITREEMAEVLQQVLKRKISLEEAMEIASGIDENKDGVFTVDELIKWIDEHKLVKFVEEGRDVDMDRVMESQAEKDETEGKGNDSPPSGPNDVKPS